MTGAAQVLVVSDADGAADFVAALLSRDGFVAEGTGFDRAASVALAAQPPFELVIVDAGIEPVRSIRSLADPDRARVPVLVLGPTSATPGGPVASEQSASEAGATAWLDRPVDDADLLAAVRRLLAG